MSEDNSQDSQDSQGQGSQGNASIEWTRPMLNRFKKAYGKALGGASSGAEVFTFDGHEFVIDYARYLIEYLDGEFKRMG